MRLAGAIFAAARSQGAASMENKCMAMDEALRDASSEREAQHLMLA
jgi:hypothetical protein